VSEPLLQSAALATVREPASWRICAVIVAFQPDDGFLARALEIARQVDGTVVVDNGSEPAVRARLGRSPAGPQIAVLENSRNVGVAAALNRGVEFARAHGFSHALLFDQDTEPLPDMVTSMRHLAGQRDDLERVAVIGMNFLEAARRKPGLRVSSSAEITEVATVITSGSLVPLSIAARLGPFREDFFIDLVDDEYCLRARSRGYKVLLIPRPLAVHALGDPIIRRLPWRTIGTSNHSARRRYYMTRNRIVLLKQYAAREPGWAIRTLYIRLKSFVLLLCLDDDRFRKLRLMWRGMLDGIAGSTGELPTERDRERPHGSNS
jgi:rhamnosyltransferase